LNFWGVNRAQGHCSRLKAIHGWPGSSDLFSFVPLDSAFAGPVSRRIGLDVLIPRGPLLVNRRPHVPVWTQNNGAELCPDPGSRDAPNGAPAPGAIASQRVV